MESKCSFNNPFNSSLKKNCARIITLSLQMRKIESGRWSGLPQVMYQVNFRFRNSHLLWVSSSRAHCYIIVSMIAVECTSGISIKKIPTLTADNYITVLEMSRTETELLQRKITV